MEGTGRIPRRTNQHGNGGNDSVMGDSQPTDLSDTSTESSKKTFSIPASQFGAPTAGRGTNRSNGRPSPMFYSDITSHQELPDTQDFRAYSMNEFRPVELRPLDMFVSEEPAQFMDMSDKSFADLTRIRPSDTEADLSGYRDSREDSEIPDNTHLIRSTLLEMARAEQEAKEAALQEMVNPLHDIVQSLSRLSESMLFRPAPMDMFTPVNRDWDGEQGMNYSQYSLRQIGPIEREPAQLESWSELSNLPSNVERMEQDIGDAAAMEKAGKGAEIRLRVQPAEALPESIAERAEDFIATPGDAIISAKPDIQLAVSPVEAEVEKAPDKADQGVDDFGSESLAELMKTRPAPLPLFSSAESDRGISDFVDDIEPTATQALAVPIEDVEKVLSEAPVAELETPTAPEAEKSMFQKLGDMILHPYQSIVEPALELLVGPMDSKVETPPTVEKEPEAEFQPDSPSDTMMGTTSQHSGMLLRDMPDSALTPHSYEYCYPRVAYSEFLAQLGEEKARREVVKQSQEFESPSAVSVQAASFSDLSPLGRVGSGGFEPSELSAEDEPDVEEQHTQLHALFPKKEKADDSASLEEEISKLIEKVENLPQHTAVFIEKPADIGPLFGFRQEVETESLVSMSGHMHQEVHLDEEAECDQRTPSGHELLDTESAECLVREEATEGVRYVHSEPSFESKSTTFMERVSVTRQPFGDVMRLPEFTPGSHLAKLREENAKSAVEKAEALLASICGIKVHKDVPKETLAPLQCNCHSVESAETFERLMMYGASPQDLSFDSKSNSLMHEFESSLDLPSDKPSKVVKKRKLAERLSLFFEEEKRVNFEDAEILMRQDMYQEMSPVPLDFSPTKRKSGLLATIGKLFRRKESGKKEANSAPSSEQDAVTSVESLAEVQPFDGEEDLDDVEPLGMSLRSSPAMISFPNLVTLHLDGDSKLKRKSAGKLSTWKHEEFGSSYPTEGVTSMRTASATSEGSHIRPFAVSHSENIPSGADYTSGPGMTDSVQTDRVGIAHMDMSYYEPSITNHSGDAVEAGSHAKTAMPGGPANLPIDMDVIHPFKKVMEYGGLYGDHCSIILFWACYLPSRLHVNYTHTMEQLYRYVATCLELLADENYKVVFFNGAVPHDCEPPLPWLRDIFGLMGHDKSRKTLDKILLVHPDRRLKDQLKVMNVGAANKHFLNKMELVDNLEKLQDAVSPEAMEFMTIPDHIRNYDAELGKGKLPMDHGLNSILCK